MELKLVYRALRKISEWTVTGFYEEVYVDGGGHVPKDGPLIIASTHHNEIIDIATLAVTIPHRRHLSFWAKSSLFKNPIAGAILSSSGAIPVNRNPDTVNPTPATQTTQNSLFEATTHALARGEAIGVFPEGTSYTEPRIMQVKGGAGWAAVEYVRSRGEGRRVVIVPVAVVYTDKSQYRSRVLVRYGPPITVPTPTGHQPPDYPLLVKGLTKQIEEELVRLSINSPDWDTLNAAKMAREIMWDGEGNVPLVDFVDVSQRLVDLFTETHTEGDEGDRDGERLGRAKRALIKYLALLHYTGISHASLVYLLPSLSPSFPLSTISPRTPAHHTQPPKQNKTPRAITFALTFLRTHLQILLHPYTYFFIPGLVPFLPGYLFAKVGVWVLNRGAGVRVQAGKGDRGKEVHGGEGDGEGGEEEEAQAQVKAVLGGVGVGVGCLSVGLGVVKSLIRFGSAQDPGGDRDAKAVDTLRAFGMILAGGAGGDGAKTKRLLGILGVLYMTTWVLVKWHNLFVSGNYRRFKHLLTAYKIILGLLSPRSSDIPLNALGPYTVPPLPAINPYIKRTSQPRPTNDPANPNPNSLNSSSLPPPPTAKIQKLGKRCSTRKLIRHLLEARVEATLALGEFLKELGLDELRGGEGKEGW